MTVLTIRAQDTATAMDEIVEKLGKDSFIIGTKKIGNEIFCLLYTSDAADDP